MYRYIYIACNACTYTHTYLVGCLLAYLQTCIHTYIHTNKNTYIHKYIHTYIHTHEHNNTYIHIHTSCVCAYLCIYVYNQVCIHRYIYIHMYIYICICLYHVNACVQSRLDLQMHVHLPSGMSTLVYMPASDESFENDGCCDNVSELPSAQVLRLCYA